MNQTTHEEFFTKDSEHHQVVEKGQLLIKGDYSSYPDRLDELGLSNNAVVLAQRMLKAIRRDEQAIYDASQNELAKLIDVTKKTAARAVDELLTARVVAVMRRTGGRSRYFFQRVELWGTGNNEPSAGETSEEKPVTGDRLPDTTPTGVKIPPPQGNNSPGVEIPPVENLPKTGVEITPNRGKNSPAALYGTRARHSTATVFKKNPPTPQGGDVGFAPKDEEEKREEVTGEEKNEIQTILDQVDSAYREVRGHGMPSNWTRRIRRDCRNGDPAIFQNVDARMIKKALALCASKKGIWRIDWLFTAIELEAARNPLPKTPAMENKHDEERRAEEQKKRHDDAKSQLRLHWFRKQPRDVQTRYIESHKKGLFKKARHETVEGIAALAAWRDRKNQQRTGTDG